MEMDEIQQTIRKLPASYQAQVLDFAEYLVAKAQREAAREEETTWAEWSLAAAMRDMEREDGPTYTLDDVEVSFQ